MAQKYQSFPGMDDILPGEVEKWQWLEQKARVFFDTWGFQEIRTPILEPTELFTRSIGETTDIVHKEMYSLVDRGERSMTMRPEMTASVARAVIQHSLTRNQSLLRLYYMGAMFRAERPQAGRKRQFHQIGAEIINDPKNFPDTNADVLMIDGAHNFFQFLNLDNIKVKVNDLTHLNGPEGDAIRKKLQDYFSKYKSDLDKDSVYRLDKNVLRIFDSKEAKTQEICAGVPWEKISPEREEFKVVVSTLKDRGISLIRDRQLVRGLDYYTGVVFEFTAEGLGSQNAVAGGGRYNELFKELGGPEVHCTGFALGMERLLTALNHQDGLLDKMIASETVYVAPIAAEGEDTVELLRFAQNAGFNLRSRGLRVILNEAEKNIAKHLKKANKLKCSKTVIIGPEEFSNRQFKIKDMNASAEVTVDSLEALLNALLKEHTQDI